MRNIIHRVILSVVTMVPYVFLASSADAVPINTWLSSPTSTITFSEIVLPELTAVGANYGGLGVTFSGNVLYDAPPPLPPVGLGPNFIAADVVQITGDGHWLITFNTLVKEVAFAYASDPATTTFIAKRNGSIVEQFSAETAIGPAITNNIFGFQNILFDQVEINAIPNSQLGYDAVGNGMDNLQFSTVPEPSSLALLGLGLAGLAVWGRRKTT